MKIARSDELVGDVLGSDSVRKLAIYKDPGPKSSRNGTLYDLVFICEDGIPHKVVTKVIFGKIRIFLKMLGDGEAVISDQGDLGVSVKFRLGKGLSVSNE